MKVNMPLNCLSELIVKLSTHILKIIMIQLTVELLQHIQLEQPR